MLLRGTSHTRYLPSGHREAMSFLKCPSAFLANRMVLKAPVIPKGTNAKEQNKATIPKAYYLCFFCVCHSYKF